MANRQKILILGASGMLGNAVYRTFATSPGFDVVGTVRNASSKIVLPEGASGELLMGVDAEQVDSLVATFEKVRPDIVINCIGLVKQLAVTNDPLLTLPINAALPHRLARISALVDARLIHVSTDCVFTGRIGDYRESDEPDAQDLYGRSKLLGEVDYPNAITLRTSIIGTELGSAHGLIGWFLDQTGPVKGFTKAIFSGLPTAVLAQVMRDNVVPNPALCGLWHVSADPIAKFDLLQLVATEYGKNVEIIPDDQLVIDRSLNSSRFREATGWSPPSWRQLITQMRQFG
ncbi:MAG: NAD(P)-dependent oxidoreductase [Sphingomonadaceae bacterium PASS1]|nr:MAG: NAD(P)-dependent oxidoreductase [Sphingomonadaceae bacterium PASS1]